MYIITPPPRWSARFLLVVLVVLSVFNAARCIDVHPTSSEPKMRLSFRQSSQVFRIMQLTDLHLGERVVHDNQTIQTIRSLLDHESDTDLVVISGDIFSADMMQEHGSKETHSAAQRLRQLWGMLQAVFAQRRIPYVISLGNHDDGMHWTRADIIKEYATPYRHLVSTDHYSVPILAHTKDRVALQLIMMHSASNRCFDKKHVLSEAGRQMYHCNQTTSVLGKWFDHEAQRFVNASQVPPAILAFSHYPDLQILQMGRDVSIYRGDRGPILTSGMRGRIHELVNCGRLQDTQGASLFASLKRQSSRMAAVLSGHDHNNDFIGLHDGVVLGYGRKTGAGSYGDHPRGARILEFKIGSGGGSDDERMFTRVIAASQMVMRSYIRQHNGNVVTDSGVSVSVAMRKKLEAMQPAVTPRDCSFM